MTGLALCALAFGLTWWAGKKSLGLGLVALLTFGYFYGIVRANFLTTFTYFIFDSALIGLYLSQKFSDSGDRRRSNPIGIWLLLLMLWPCLLVLIPFQPLLVSLVGLRGAIFFLPMAWLGKRLRSRDLEYFSLGLAALNLAAMGFAAAEYFMGVQRFYPFNAATIIIYASADVTGGFFRIPAIFINAHAYGGMMVASIPYLLGAWEQAQTRVVRTFALCGIAAAMLGVLMSATRLNFVIGSALVLLAVWKGDMKASRRVLFVVLILGMTAVALRNERFQRFKSLSDSEGVEERISGSVNRGFFEILLDYPLGNGLGGGGTSIPYFLEGQVRNPVATENEYARILCEQGIIGLLLWLGFIGWFLSRYRTAFAAGPWATSRRMIWILSAIGLVTSVIGNGMLTAIPGTALLLLGIGLASSPMAPEVAETRRQVGVRQVISPQGRLRPVPSV
jgi:hypothetical protein